MGAVGAGVVETFGPFLIPVAVFVLGIAGFGTLWLLQRWGLFGGSGG